jgi:hypothetical protein
MEKAEQVEPVRHRHDNDIFLACEVGAFVQEPVAGAAGETAPVQPHHHGPVAGESRREDIEVETVLTHRLLAIECEDL